MQALRWDVGASSDDGFERKSSMLYKGHIDAVMCLHILVCVCVCVSPAAAV